MDPQSQPGADQPVAIADVSANTKPLPAKPIDAAMGQATADTAEAQASPPHRSPPLAAQASDLEQASPHETANGSLVETETFHFRAKPSGPANALRPEDPEATEAYGVTRSVPSHVLPPGAMFAKYRIEKSLGQGAMGAVYLATDQQLGRRVALKIPKLQGYDAAEINARFFREAKAAATIQHPNICPVFDYGELSGQCYMVMAYVDGAPLSSYLTRGKPIQERQAALLVRKLALALQEAHDKGIVHRDLKPSNIMIDQRKEPIVMDFGLARRDHHDDTRLTNTGAFLGTPVYTSPEQIRNHAGTVGPRSDVYTLGVILYELLTGHLPFEGNGSMSVLAQILADTPPEARERNPKISAAVNQVCLRAMAKDPAQRYESMKDFARELTLLLKGRLKVEDKADAGEEMDELEAAELPELPELPPERTAGSDSSLPSERLTVAPIDFLQTSPIQSEPVTSVAQQVTRRRGQPWLFGLAGGAGLAGLAGLIALAMILAQPGEGTFKLDLPGAPASTVITLDGASIDRAAIAAGVPLEPGQHHVSVTAPGYVLQRQAVDLFAGQTVSLSMTLVPEATEGPRPHRDLGAPGGMNSDDRPVALPPATPPIAAAEGDVLFADFEADSFGSWTVEGEAFGPGPVEVDGNQLLLSLMPWKDELGKFVHSNQWWHDNRVSPGADRKFGKLTSPPFVVTHPFINFTIFGGRQPGKAEFQLLVDGVAVRSMTGNHSHFPMTGSWDVGEYLGRDACLRMVDEAEGGLDFIAVDNIRFSSTDGRQQWLDRIQQQVAAESIEWRGHRYWFSPWQASMWDSDESLFELETLIEGGQLLTVEDDDEHAFVMGNLRGPTWLGLRGDGNGGWRRLAGQPLGYHRWREGKPFHDYTRRAFMDETGDWLDLTIGSEASPADGNASLVFEWGEAASQATPLRNPVEQRRLADRWLGQVEWMDVRTASRYLRLRPGDVLPAEDVELLGLRFKPAAELSAADLEPFQAIATLTHLELPETRDSALALVNACPQLRHLQLSGGGFDGRTLDRLAGDSELRVLEIWETRLKPDFYDKFSQTRRLRVLSLTGGPFDASMLESLQGNRQLKQLFLNGVGSLGDPGIALVANFRELQNLMLWGCGVTDEHLTAIGTLTRLRDIQLGWNTEIRGSGLPSLRRLEKLQNLSLFHCSLDRDGLEQLPPFPALTTLYVGENPLDRIPESLGDKLPALQRFDFHTTQVGDSSLAALQRLPMLRAINVERANLSEAALRSLDQGWGLYEVKK